MMRVTEELVRRVRITGRRDERDRAVDYCTKRGLQVQHIGTPRLRGKREVEARARTGARGILADVGRFWLVAEGPLVGVLFALLLCAAVLSEAEAGGYGGRGHGGHGGHGGYYGGRGPQQVTVWGLSAPGPGGVGWWGVYRFGGGVVLTAPPPPPATYWLYCQDTGQYYPYVRDCVSGWLRVEPPGDGR